MDELAGLGVRKIALVMILSVGLGIVLGLVVAWIVWPVEYYEGPPSLLKKHWKDDYLYLISVGYALDGDLEKAKARLSDLGLPGPGTEMIRLANKLKGEGASDRSLQALAMLAYALKVSAPELQAYLPTPTPVPVFTPTHTPVLPTPLIAERPSLQPTPTEAPERAFVLKAREMRCHSDDEEPLLEIEVLDSAGEPLPGAEVIVSWEGGEEKLFTGLKPDKGPGYADFVMARTYTYRVRVSAPAGEEAQGLTAQSEECPSERPFSSWHIVFQETRH